MKKVSIILTVCIVFFSFNIAIASELQSFMGNTEWGALNKTITVMYDAINGNVHNDGSPEAYLGLVFAKKILTREKIDVENGRIYSNGKNIDAHDCFNILLEEPKIEQMVDNLVRKKYPLQWSVEQSAKIDSISDKGESHFNTIIIQ